MALFRKERVLLAFPLMMVAVVHAALLAGRFHLGYWPRAHLDDPKSIEGFWMWMSDFALVLTFFGPPLMLVMSTYSVVLNVVNKPDRWQQIVLEIAAGVLLLILAIAFLQLDPFGVMEWLMD